MRADDVMKGEAIAAVSEKLGKVLKNDHIVVVN